MRGNLFLVFVAVGIGISAAAYGYGGVFLMIYGIGTVSLGWGAMMAITRRDRDNPRIMPRSRQPSRIL